MKRLRTPISILASAAVCASLAASTPAAAGPQVAERAAGGAKVKTDFWFKHNAYGTKVSGNVLVESGPTAYSYLPCTKRAGASHRNEIAGATVPGVANVEAVESRGWTAQKNGVTSVTSINKIAGASLANGRVQVDAVRVKARAFHDGQKLRARGSSRIVGLSIDGRQISLGTKYRKFTVPGVGTLHVNQRMRRHEPGLAQMRVVALRLVSHLDNTVVRVAHARAQIARNGKSGPFAGPAFASRVRLADNNLRSGRTGLQPMPCAGTNGKVLENSTVSGIEAADGVNLEGVSSKAWTHRTVRKGWTKSKIASASLAGGLVKVEGLVARAFAHRKGDRVIRSARGTKIASLKVGHQTINVDNLVPGKPITVPGVAKVTFKKVDRTKSAVTATALEVVLFPNLPMLESKIELARARMQVRKG